MAFTYEQEAAIKCKGDVIVSASAGSGKTTVMIERLVNAVMEGTSLDNILAVTFTKKAAAQIKEKLRKKIIEKMAGTEDETVKKRLKEQLVAIPSADISTIHSFCARLVRTYFYVVGVDGSFDILATDDSEYKELRDRAFENLFERLYDEENPDFMLLLKFYRKKRRDDALKTIITEEYSAVRSVAHYREKMDRALSHFTDEGFEQLCGDLQAIYRERYEAIEKSLMDFRDGFSCPDPKKRQVYMQICGEMYTTLEWAKQADVFAGLPDSLYVTPKPRDTKTTDPAVKAAGDYFKTMRDIFNKKYQAVRSKDTLDRWTERERFLQSGEIAAAFTHILEMYDDEFAAIKKEENKLDYNDLEHYALELLSDPAVRKDVGEKYKLVFVDEYQDVNPVQEDILSSIGGQVFLVGDVKQAIYGFRGSKSRFFNEKFAEFSVPDSGRSALPLTFNFRSADNILTSVNRLFEASMTETVCGSVYDEESMMKPGGLYPANTGNVALYYTGKDKKSEVQEKIYSVYDDAREARVSREGQAVLRLVKKHLKEMRYDISTQTYVPIQPGDICILARKNNQTDGIVQVLESEGLPVSGAQAANICDSPEVKQMLDILSLVDNSAQDIPLITALLSPLGGLTETELAEIRTKYAEGHEEKPASFRVCCNYYKSIMAPAAAKAKAKANAQANVQANAAGAKDAESSRREKCVPLTTAEKLAVFDVKLQKLRDAAGILNAGAVIDKILFETGLEAEYSAGGGDQIRNILRLAQEGPDLTLSAFLRKIKQGGYSIPAPACAPSDSIKVMSMHASKGLEFPVVIIADICKMFTGLDMSDIYFDEDYGFAPRAYDEHAKTYSNTVLRRLVKARSGREDIKNEMNLFYVACTRAMWQLDIMFSKELKPYNEASAYSATTYAALFDFASSGIEMQGVEAAEEEGPRKTIEEQAQELDPANDIPDYFEIPYLHAESTDLPIKSSASAIMKRYGDAEQNASDLFRLEDRAEAEDYATEDSRVPYGTQSAYGAGSAKNTDGSAANGSAEGVKKASSRDVGDAYHMFLNLCNFKYRSAEDIEQELITFRSGGAMPEEWLDLLSADKLAEILQMPVFDGLDTAETYCEQQFLCRLPAYKVMDTGATDNILIQGAFDLLVHKDGKWQIVDYKHSWKDPDRLRRTYLRQMCIYRSALSAITGVPEEDIPVTLVNIQRHEQISIAPDARFH